MKSAWLGGVAALAAAGVAHAADLPRKMPVKALPAPVAYDWTGLYGGFHWGTAIGASTASTGATRGFLGETQVSEAGLVGGGQVGFNWQFAPTWLVGLEGDFGYLRTDRTFADWNEFVQVGVKTSWYGTARARLGYVTGPSLLYLTGGAAFVRIDDTFGGSTTFAGLAPATSSTTKAGWTIGGGIETKLSHNWSATAEYLYVDAGSTSFASNPFTVANSDTTTVKHSFHLLKSGVNYKFGGPDEPLPFFDFNGPLLGPAHNWVGFYAGGNLGGGISLTRIGGGAPTLPRLGETDLNGTGFTGGAQAGYNLVLWQKWLVGVEGDVGYLGLNNSQNNWNDSSFTFTQKTDGYGTMRGRVGNTTGPALLYATGGAAFVRVRDSFALAGAGVDATTRTATGWTFGGGTEVALNARWSAKLEYLYIDAGTTHHALPAATVDFADFDHKFHVVRAGLNYRFGGDDVVRARY
jgi:outer membrane immunogenic protein